MSTAVKGIRPEVMNFAQAMEDAMQRGDRPGRGGWRNLDIDTANARAFWELAELQEAMRKNQPLDRIRDEAADVANFLMMLVMAYRKESPS